MNLFARLAMVSVAAFSLWGCVETRVPTRKVPFDETAFVPYARSGTARIKGTAYTLMQYDRRQTATSKSVILLEPANDYTDEIIKRRYNNRGSDEPADASYAKYIRRAKPDDSGHFVFSNLPAGSYYVSCHMRWQNPSHYTDANGVLQTAPGQNLDQWIYAKVSVASGQTADVENWVQGN
jgi:hypothetical protein